MGRFTDGNHPGNGQGKQGKGDFVTTIHGDHILGTTGDDTGDSSGATIYVYADTNAVDHNLMDLQGGNDLFNGFAGNDKAYGNDGNDDLNGHEGNDVLVGGAGDDVIEGGADADILDGGADNDTVSYASSDAAVTVDLSTDTASGGHAEGDTLVAGSFENIVGSGFDDTLTGDEFANVIHGGDGIDTIAGGAGVDTIVGGMGADDLTGGADADSFVYNSADEGGDTITDFSAVDGDTIDLTALGLDDIAAGNFQDAIADGYLFLDGNSLYVDLDGGGTGDALSDDVLIANLNTTIDLGVDVLL